MGSGMESTIELGRTGLRVSRVGLGTWQWGDRIFWQYGTTHNDADLREAFQVSLEGGINFFDTAEIYGRGRSETLLGEYIRQIGPSSGPLVIASKYMPYPWRLTRSALGSALRGSLRRLGMSRVDLYQIHWPMPPMPVSFWADSLAEVILAGLASAAGVSNYSREQMARAHEVMAARGVALTSNQVEFSLLNRRVENSGLLALCRKLDITLIAYSPLAKGLLTGKYTPDTPPSGLRGRLTSKSRLSAIQPLLTLMREIGAAHEGKTPAQVALNWAIAKGTLPIPGAKNARQARENAAAATWRLTEGEVAALDLASSRLSTGGSA
jgi:aryl-alcohol dehydrogenase-like predicted oxidoreductase